MAKKMKTAISPTREENYPEWYQQVVKAADLAENSPVRGCMVIKPWGYSLWENMQRVLDRKFKDTGHTNAYFPLFIPVSYLEKEAQHVDGFAKECAVVTHHRLEADGNGKLIPAGPLEEPLVVRPTSETIIGEMYAKWVQSYRDLPILINQWANVVRWEMRTRLFLRTTEFLWQEGHTAHATEAEAMEETVKMLEVYADFAENYMAMPVLKGEKTEGERFPGAVNTFCIEAMMQDRKALQAGTSHFLGQNFARAAGIKYQSEAGLEELAWTTSWGVSTRLIGGMVMTHSDDDGLVLPPRLAPAHIVILPIIRNEESRAQVMEYCDRLTGALKGMRYDGAPVEVICDTREGQGGGKIWGWIKKGIPMWVEVGPRDVESNTVFAGRRDGGKRSSKSYGFDEFVNAAPSILEDIQNSLFERALKFRTENTADITSKDDFYAYFGKDAPGGFARAHWNGSGKVEEMLQNDLNVTIRCIPQTDNPEPGTCIFTGEPSAQAVVFAKSY